MNNLVLERVNTEGATSATVLNKAQVLILADLFMQGIGLQNAGEVSVNTVLAKLIRAATDQSSAEIYLHFMDEGKKDIIEPVQLNGYGEVMGFLGGGDDAQLCADTIKSVAENIKIVQVGYWM